MYVPEVKKHFFPTGKLNCEIFGGYGFFLHVLFSHLAQTAKSPESVNLIMIFRRFRCHRTPTVEYLRKLPLIDEPAALLTIF